MVLAESSRDAGAIAGPARPRGRPAADPRDAQIARLRKEKAQLEQELASPGGRRSWTYCTPGGSPTWTVRRPRRS